MEIIIFGFFFFLHGFRYKLDDGQIFRGKSYAVSSDDHYRTKFIMMGTNKIFYWAGFTNNELENEKPFSKDVRLGTFFKECSNCSDWDKLLIFPICLRNLSKRFIFWLFSVEDKNEDGKIAQLRDEHIDYTVLKYGSVNAYYYATW